jgi:hypothetical protein
MASNYDHEAAFAAYAKGASIEDIADQLNIPVETLQRRAKDKAWIRLKKSVVQTIDQLTIIAPQAKAEEIEANRKKELDHAERLYQIECEDAVAKKRVKRYLQLPKLEEALVVAQNAYQDALIINQSINTPETREKLQEAANAVKEAEMVLFKLEKDAFMSMKELKDLASSLRDIAALRRDALGDTINTITGESKQNAPTGNVAQTITINMPGIFRDRHIKDVQEPTTIEIKDQPEEPQKLE